MSDSDGINLECPRCELRLCLPTTAAGTQVSCPDCNARIEVPMQTGIQKESQWAWPKSARSRTDDRPASAYDRADDDEFPPDVAESRAAQRRSAAARIRELQERGLKGANWFFWVAGMSVVNSIVLHAGGQFFFVVGSFAKAVGEQNAGLDAGLKIFAIGFSVVAALIVAGFGMLARKGYLIPFAIGMVLYLLDGLIFLAFQDILSVAFHGWALYCMWCGFSAFRQIKAVEAELQDRLAEDAV
jgi:hypothetical protein